MKREYNIEDPRVERISLSVGDDGELYMGVDWAASKLTRRRRLNWPLLLVMAVTLAFWLGVCITCERHIGPQGETHIPKQTKTVRR